MRSNCHRKGTAAVVTAVLLVGTFLVPRAVFAATIVPVTGDATGADIARQRHAGQPGCADLGVVRSLSAVGHAEWHLGRAQLLSNERRDVRNPDARAM